jgi:hypothetical protein
MTHLQFVRAAALLLLVGSAAAHAQAPSSQPRETAARAAQQAATDKARAAIEAERTRPRLSGIWRLAAPVTQLLGVDGKPPALTPTGQKQSRGQPDPADRCLPPGTPRLMFTDAPFLLTQAPVKVTLFSQHRHVVRHVFLDGPLKLPDDADPTWEGHSSGRWEGDTLVIETAGFNGRQWIHASGLPQSAAMKITERLRLVDPDTLEDVLRVEDAAYYRSAFTTRLLFKRQPAGTELPEQECSEKLLEYPLKEYAPPR